MAAPVQRDEQLELRIDSLAYGGNGVARLDGFVVFVRDGLQGETVRARRCFQERTALCGGSTRSGAARSYKSGPA